MTIFDVGRPVSNKAGEGNRSPVLTPEANQPSGIGARHPLPATLRRLVPRAQFGLRCELPKPKFPQWPNALKAVPSRLLPQPASV